MKISHINLKRFYSRLLDHDLFLDCYTYTDNFEFNNTSRKNILVLPGGGYSFISEREKDPIMFSFLSMGYNAFSLSYSCNRAYPIPHIDLAIAMDYIAKHYVDNRTILVGFSSGGHLASSYGYLYKELASNKKEEKRLRPYALVLGYSLINLMNKKYNLGCSNRISGGDEDLKKKLSADLNVNKDYPPTFIFATKTDECVDYHHSLALHNALNKKKVKNRCIIYPSGPHGLALANEATFANNNAMINKKVSGWPLLAHEFIKSIEEK